MKVHPGRCDRSRGIEYLDKVVDIDQSPIGRTPRSNPATYTGLFNDIRDLFASTQDAKSRGYGPGRFSFNVRGGRCEACSGDGAAEDRDALPAGHLCALRGVQGQAVQPGAGWKDSHFTAVYGDGTVDSRRCSARNTAGPSAGRCSCGPALPLSLRLHDPGGRS